MTLNTSLSNPCFLKSNLNRYGKSITSLWKISRFAGFFSVPSFRLLLTPHCITSDLVAWASQSITIHYNPCHCIPWHRVVWNGSTPDMSWSMAILALHYISLHYMSITWALLEHYITLHYIKYHYIAWHYVYGSHLCNVMEGCGINSSGMGWYVMVHYTSLHCKCFCMSITTHHNPLQSIPKHSMA